MCFLKALNSASRGDASHCRIWIGRIFTELLFDSVVTFLPTPATPPTGCRSAFSSVKESSGRPLCDATIAAIFISCTAALTRCLLLYRLLALSPPFLFWNLLFIDSPWSSFSQPSVYISGGLNGPRLPPR